MANRNNDRRAEQNNRNKKKTSPPTPSWLRYIFMIAAVVLLVVACYWLKSIVVPLLLAIFVAYIFDPVIGWFEQFHIPRTPAIIVTIFALIAGLVLVSILVAVTSTDDAQRIAQSVVAFKEKVESETPELPAGLMQRFLQSKYADQIRQTIEENISQVASYAADIGPIVGAKMLGAVTGLGRGVMWFVAAVAKTLLFAIVAFYLLKDFAVFKTGALRLVPFERRERVVIVLGKIDELLHGFFRGQLLVSLSLALIYAIGLSALSVPFALIIAIVGGLANIVPYLGLVLGLLPAVLLAVVSFGDVWHPLGTVAVFVVGQALEGTVHSGVRPGARVCRAAAGRADSRHRKSVRHRSARQVSAVRSTDIRNPDIRSPELRCPASVILPQPPAQTPTSYAASQRSKPIRPGPKTEQ